jgi:hypothetical protein
MTPMSTGDPEAADPPRPPSVDSGDEPPRKPRGGSGTAGPHTAEKEQAGSYARDAEQDPERERHERADTDV